MIPRYTRPAMAAIWSDEARFNLWLEIETLALEGMVKQGIAPASALESVRKKGAFSAERVLEIEETTKHDVIAFLTNVAENVGPDARYLHFGMTSSDLLDTAFAVQLVRASDLLLKGLDDLMAAVKKQALCHKHTVCVGRSHGVHAEPTTFGLKFALWYAELMRQRTRLEHARGTVAVGAISGAVGTYAHLPPAVEEHVMKALGLECAPVSTQVIQRDRHAEYFLTLANVGATLEKICLEVRHLQRTEVREAYEGFSKGQKGSSAMPHKRNPILSENVTGLARLLRGWAMTSLENVALWHERDISHSSVERVIAPDSTVTLDFMLARVRSIVDNLEVHPENMLKNLELTRGLVFSGSLLIALAAKGISREDAYALVQEHALATWGEIDSGVFGTSFSERVRGDKRIRRMLSEAEIDEVFSLEAKLRHVDFIFQRVFGKEG